VGNEPKKTVPAGLKYRRVEVAAIKKVRRGKHHELVQGIVREMKMLAVGSAIEIPLADVGGIGLANLRSAVHRVCIAEGWTIETLADEKNLYVWKTKKPEL
jgi:hypothetical protein